MAKVVELELRDIVKIASKTNKISMQKVAKELGILASSLSAKLSGGRATTYLELDKIAKALKMKMSITFEIDEEIGINKDGTKCIETKVYKLKINKND